MEKEEIVNEVLEQVLLKLPELVGNLMAHQAAFAKLNKKFYDENPEFKEHRDVVRSVVEETEGVNTFEDYEEILKKAVPVIKRRISTVKTLDLKSHGNFNRDLNGVL